MAADNTPMPQSAELRDEFTRWAWMPKAWGNLPAESRSSYDDWVLRSRSARRAQRRAKLVSRRCYTGRPWAGPIKRTVQGLRDYLAHTPDAPGSPDTTLAN